MTGLVKVWRDQICLEARRVASPDADIACALRILSAPAGARLMTLPAKGTWIACIAMGGITVAAVELEPSLILGSA